MKALLILGAVVVVSVGLPALGHLIRRVIGRPLTSEQLERDALLEKPAPGRSLFLARRRTR
jgi:hypothetical protein